jgi:hypothetical protein
MVPHERGHFQWIGTSTAGRVFSLWVSSHLGFAALVEWELSGNRELFYGALAMLVFNAWFAFALWKDRRRY